MEKIVCIDASGTQYIEKGKIYQVLGHMQCPQCHQLLMRNENIIGFIAYQRNNNFKKMIKNFLPQDVEYV